MTYIVRIEIGKGYNKTITESIPLPTRERVCQHIKRNPFVRLNTKIKVTNLKTKKSIIGTQYRFCRKKDY